MKTAAVLIEDGSLPPGICHPRRKNANAQGLAAGGGASAQLELTDA